MILWRYCVLFPLAILVLASPPSHHLRAAESQDPLPWDFDPYRVMIWVAGADESTIEKDWREPILAFLNRDYSAVWRTEVIAAPPSLSALAERSFEAIDYASMTADDPVLAMKRNHENASRIRYPSDVATNLRSIRVVESYAAAVRQRGAAVDNADLHGMVSLFQPVEGGLLDLREAWAEESTEAILLPRGIALGLEPVPRLVELDVAGRMEDLFANYDKIFVVLVDGPATDTHVRAREIDATLRLAGPIIERRVSDPRGIPASVARAVSDAFAPVVRLDDVGSDTAVGRLRAGGLILNPDSPAAVKVDDYLQPVLRKDGRGGEPVLLGIIDWTYLRVTSKDEARLDLKLYSGRDGALQGRRNSRTHRLALKIRPTLPSTTLRLHAKGDPSQPLVGYDIFEKDLESEEMRFLGSTNWDGTLTVEKTDSPMRLLYVKNGSAVLARLPIVPGQSAVETADLVADDTRLRAEAYIRGVENAIVDLVAIRKLFATAIRSHIEQGDLQTAEELLGKLREEPSFKMLADDMEQKATAIRSPSAGVQKRIDNMFRDTRELLGKHLTATLVRELEGEFFAAGGAKAGAPLAKDAGEAAPEDGASKDAGAESLP